MDELYMDEVRRHNVTIAKKALNDVISADCPLDSLYVKNCKFYQPYFFPGRVTPINPDTQGDIIAHEDTVSIFHTWQYDLDTEEIYTTQDPNCIIIFNSGKGTVMRDDGKDYPYENSYVHIFYFTDGKISEYYEYADPMALMDALGIKHPQLPPPEETEAKYKALGLI